MNQPLPQHRWVLLPELACAVVRLLQLMVKPKDARGDSARVRAMVSAVLLMVGKG